MADHNNIATPNMESAGVELMALSFKMEKHPEFAADAARIRDIGAWASVGRISDTEKAMIEVMGAVFDAMRKRGVNFSETLPIAGQFIEFFNNLPDPLPGQFGYIDQATLLPTKRGDIFEAEATIGEVRRWTGPDNINRAVVHECMVRPINGIEEEVSLYAEGEETQTLQDNSTATLRLRTIGGALKVLPAADGS